MIQKTVDSFSWLFSHGVVPKAIYHHTWVALHLIEKTITCIVLLWHLMCYSQNLIYNTLWTSADPSSKVQQQNTRKRNPPDTKPCPNWPKQSNLSNIQPSKKSVTSLETEKAVSLLDKIHMCCPVHAPNYQFSWTTTEDWHGGLGLCQWQHFKKRDCKRNYEQVWNEMTGITSYFGTTVYSCPCHN